MHRGKSCGWFRRRCRVSEGENGRVDPGQVPHCRSVPAPAAPAIRHMLALAFTLTLSLPLRGAPRWPMLRHSTCPRSQTRRNVRTSEHPTEHGARRGHHQKEISIATVVTYVEGPSASFQLFTAFDWPLGVRHHPCYILDSWYILDPNCPSPPRMSEYCPPPLM